MIFGKPRVLGLDIGTNSIKIAEVKPTRDGAVLENFGIINTPINSVVSGEIADPAALSSVVQTLLKEMRTTRKIACTGMWGTAVIVKKFTIPNAERNTLKDQLNFYAEQYIPFEVSNITLAYTFLKSSSDPNSTDVLLIGAQNELVGQYINVVSNSGLKCKILDVSGFALANCFELNYGRVFNENIGILNFGAAVTNFIVLHQGEVVFCRDIPFGGNNYTSEIHKSLGITMQEADTLKSSATVKKEAPEEVNTVIQSTNEQLSEEVRNSIEFFSATSNNMNIHRLYYTGGSCLTPGMIEQVQKGTSISLEAFNPFRRVKVNNKKINSSFQKQIYHLSAVALGLGLRKVGDS